MISSPCVTVQCDQGLRENRCRNSEVFALPAFVVDREAIAKMFRVTNPDWAITAGGTVYCPQCRRIAEARILAEKEKKEVRA